MVRIIALLLSCLMIAGCQGQKNINNIPSETAAPTSESPSTSKPAKTAEPTQEPKKTEVPISTEAPSKTNSPSSLSNKTNGWGYRKIPNGRPEFTAAQIKMMEAYDCIYLGSESAKNIYLTFDEGYENGYTSVILDTLKKHSVPAAFFITTPYLNKNYDLVKRMVDEGHIVGNHTVNHPSLPSLTKDSEVEKELLDLDHSFYDLFGKNMNYFRAPKGEYSERTLNITKNLGYTNVFWSFAYLDWETNNQKGTDYAYNQVMTGLHNGAVLLLHAVSKDNANALDKIIADARAQGYTFLPLTDFK